MPRTQLTDDELEQVRGRLARAALDIFCSEGLEAVSYRRIGDVTGTSHTKAYRYFPNKEALLARMRVEALADFRAYVLQSQTPSMESGPLNRVLDFASGYVRFAVERREEYLLVFSTDQPAPTEHPELLEARREVFDLAVERVQSCIAAGLLKGDALSLAHSFWIGLHGLMTLHAANQLVHGMSLEQLVPSLTQRLFGIATTLSSDGALYALPAESMKTEEIS